MCPAPRAPQKEVIVKRSTKKVHGLFVDGIALDRISKRLNRKLSFNGLLSTMCAGGTPVVARYYTIIPHEDDSRHHSFLDAVRNAGFTVIVKRLPPKGVNRHVSIDLEMALDVVTFGFGFAHFPDSHDFHRTSSYDPDEIPRPSRRKLFEEELSHTLKGLQDPSPSLRAVTVVCPSRELTYPMELLKGYGIETTSADFGRFQSGDLLKAAAQFVDLTDADSLWR
jgi:NYN domain